MTKDDVLFGYRLQLFAEAARTNVSVACRTFGVHRSTYYAWKRQVDRHGLEMLRQGAPSPADAQRDRTTTPAKRGGSRLALSSRARPDLPGVAYRRLGGWYSGSSQCS
jgi:transposase-like protein